MLMDSVVGVSHSVHELPCSLFDEYFVKVLKPYKVTLRNIFCFKKVTSLDLNPHVRKSMESGEKKYKN